MLYIYVQHVSETLIISKTDSNFNMNEISNKISKL
jgi:hypothetical protein